MVVRFVRASVAVILFACSTEALAAPTAPSNLTATAFSTTRIDLAWNDNSGNESGFEVHRAPVTNGTPGTFALVTTVARNIRAYSDNGRAYGTSYAYRVRATQSGSSPSGYSNTASTTTLKAVTLRVAGFPASPVAGVSGTATVSLLDSKGNLASGYPGTVRFSSSDAQAVIPANVTAPTGSANVSFTLRSAGTQSLTGTDTVTATLTGNQAGIVVAPAAASQFALSFAASVVAGVPGGGSVVAYDAFGNVATGYRGTVTFSTSSANAALPPASAFTAAENGTKAFTASLNTAGTQSLSVAATGLAATVNGIVVSAGPASQLTLDYPAAVAAGVPATATVSARDAFGNLAATYRGAIAFTSTSPLASLPGTYTFTAADAGIRNFDAALNTAGAQSLTVADTANASLSAARTGIAVAAGNATRLAVTYPASVVAGTPAALGVTAVDAFGNLAIGYRGTVVFATSSANAALPASYAFTAADGGTHAFNAALNTAGTQSLTATDAGNAAVNGARTDIAVSAASASQLTLAYPASVSAGVAATATVSARDAYGNAAVGYRGTIAFSSSSANAVLPAAYTFTAGDAGSRNFDATLNTTGTQSLSVADAGNASLSAVRPGISVSAGNAARFVVSYPASVVAGAPATLTVTAQDIFGNAVPTYSGTVAFASSSSNATLPEPYTFTPADAGTHAFSASLNSAGTQSVTATDAANAAIAGVRSGITVSAGATAKLAVSYPGAVVAGTSSPLTVAAQDAYGNPTAGYRGTVAFATSSANAFLPATYTFTATDGGIRSFNATLNTAGTQSVTATDAANGAITGVRTDIAVSAATLSKLGVSYPATVVAGVASPLVVSAQDIYGNTVSGYAGTVTFTSNGAGGSMPPNYTFTAADAGTRTFSASLTSAGSRIITARDAAVTSIFGSRSVVVTGAEAASLSVTTSGNFVAGTPVNVTVTARDAYFNTASGYNGTVTFSTTAAKASLPSDYAFTTADNGSHVFSVALNSSATQNLTVRDTVNGALTKTSTHIVTAGPPAKFAWGIASFTAGTANSPVVSVHDQFDNRTDAYRGTIAFTSSSADAVLPANYTWTSGSARNFPITFNRPGTHTVTATDTVDGAITASASYTVNVGAATRLKAVLPANVTAGTASTIVVSAEDNFGNAATGYRGTVTFTSTSSNASLPASYQFTAADGGTHTFPVTLNIAGARTVTVRDSFNSLTGNADTTVGPGEASRFTLAYPPAVTAGQPRDLDVTAHDTYGNVATGYAGSVAFTSTSPNANLPAAYAFTAEDAGTHRFTAALNSEGTRAITATDAASSGTNGTVSGIVVTGGPATRLDVAGYPSLITAGRFAGVNVRALDAYGNLSPGYAGTVTFNSSDAQALLPLPTTLVGGKARVTATLRTTGIQSIGASDTTFSALQTGITVNPAPATCVGGTWRNTRTGQIVNAGPGLREPPVLSIYSAPRATPTGPIVTPACPYFTGLVRLPIFMVDYADYEPLTDMPDPNKPGSVGLPGYVKASPAEIDWHVNGPAGAAQYYRDVSGGQADLEFDVFGWISSSTPGSYLKPRATYITPRSPGPGYLCAGAQLTTDVMRNAIAFHGANLAAYDSDGNGVLDGAVILHEGRLGFCAAANLVNLNGSAGPSTTPPTFTFDDMRKLVPADDPNQPLFANQNVFAYLYNNIPERADNGPLRPVATWTHEIGHLLLGYPDYYDNASRMADWALSAGHMDIPTHPAAWEKWLFAHWIEPVNATSSGTHTLDANEIPDGGVYDGGTFLVRIPIDNDPSHFLTVENRWFDAEGNTGTQWARSNYRESGLLIVEVNLNLDDFPSPIGAPKQVYRHPPSRAAPPDSLQAWRVGDTFSQCYTTMCVTITPTSPPGAQMQFSLTVTPR